MNHHTLCELIKKSGMPGEFYEKFRSWSPEELTYNIKQKLNILTACIESEINTIKYPLNLPGSGGGSYESLNRNIDIAYDSLLLVYWILEQALDEDTND